VSGNAEGLYVGQPVSAYRTGFGDPSFRLAINLLGAPAMTPSEFAAYRQDTIVGASLVVVPPLGAYDSSRLVNIGSNRWAFRPEIGLSQAVGHWTLEAYAGAWFFTANADYDDGKRRTQDPIAQGQIHVIYTFAPRLWLSLDANYYVGGRTAVDGVQNSDALRNSRLGAVLAVPLTSRQSIKFTYSNGVYAQIGQNFTTYGLNYQYVWLGRP
jgi:hypothetical protein